MATVVPAGDERPNSLIEFRHGGDVSPVQGLAVVTAECLVAALAVARPGLLMASTAAILLGAGYGVCMIVGLTEVEELATPSVGYQVALVAMAAVAH